ncbi:bacteriocin fulvocin C-related protein [Kibdelosporangium philippinense]|uniref:bacteriocin fulvocin C-related protein n=1 Tax=Kibdelosporangium philippinense TaxID=211113 RepID=UPI003557DE5C
MGHTDARWILAFDGTCGQCRNVSEIVHKAGGGRIEVLPLGDGEVEAWRRESLGEDAPWAPTLLCVSSRTVRAWIGKTLAIPLVRRLGIVASWRVLNALGQLRTEATVSDGAQVSRAKFFRFAAGAVVAGGLLTGGALPAAAAGVSARKWIQENLEVLPQTLAEFAEYPLSYRRAIFEALSVEKRSSFWVEYLTQIKSVGLNRSKAEIDVLNEAIAVASDVSTFQIPTSEAVTKRIAALEGRSLSVFGKAETDTILRTLGGAENVSTLQLPLASDCKCNIGDDWCSGCPGQRCVGANCNESALGCGSLGVKRCTGLCWPRC